MMNKPQLRPGVQGFTLVELLIAVAVIAIILVIAAPSFRDMILMQRLRSINAQVVTDMQFARAEAVSRGTLVRVSFQEPTAAMSCYTIYTSPSNAQQCNCLLGVGTACPAGALEIRTVQVPANLSVTVSVPVTALDQQDFEFAYDPATGGIYTIPTDGISRPMPRFVVEAYIDGARKLNTVVNGAGRPSVCKPALSTMPEAACPP